MKSKLFLISLLFFSQKLMAQFGVVQPEIFSLAKNSYIPCPVSDIGKIYYYTNTDVLAYCKDDNVQEFALSKWDGVSGIYYMGKVGVRKNSPSEELDILGNARSNTLSVFGKVGLDTNTPTEKLDIVNRVININSTLDEKQWAINYLGTSGRLDLREYGVTRMIINADGNINIGAPSTTNKLNVGGDVSYAGSLTVEGKGILSNTTANQLRMHIITTTSTGDSFSIANNTCKLSGFSYGNYIFTQPPTIIQGQKIAGNFIDDKLVISIENVTTTGGTIRICNNSGEFIELENAVYTLMAIGQ